MTEIPVRELRNHVSEVLRRVEAGEELVVTVSGRPVAELRPIGHRRPTMSWDEFWAGQDSARHDPGFADDIRAIVGDETTEDLPW
ncbi:MAG TPA: type II toxin-antitoxin system prevent-host-death family antitoxin [Mycobacteriales bacterium]|nr:type II toxin-antitoxin system prevent-host-death family antitoxin [Mycobacteriales bacterium]